MERRHRVLVVEDDVDLREAIRDTLEAEGYEVVLAEHGEEALAQLRAEPRPCVVLLDLMMPHMDGWKFMEQMRIHPVLANIPLVVVSAYGNAEGVRSLGAADYLRKPFQVETLLDTVKRYCLGA
jgi:CheY-like chemotaxis protein